MVVDQNGEELQVGSLNLIRAGLRLLASHYEKMAKDAEKVGDLDALNHATSTSSEIGSLAPMFYPKKKES